MSKWLRRNFLLELQSPLPRFRDLPEEASVSNADAEVLPRVVVSCQRLGIEHPDPHLKHLHSLQKFLAEQPETTVVYWDYASAPGRLENRLEDYDRDMAQEMNLYRGNFVLVLEVQGHKRYLERGWCFLQFTLACLGLIDGTSKLCVRGMTCHDVVQLAELRSLFKTEQDTLDFAVVSSLCQCLSNQDEWQAAFAAWLARLSNKRFALPGHALKAISILVRHMEQIMRPQQ